MAGGMSQEQLKKMSALDVAALGKNRAMQERAARGETVTTALEMDPLDQDWTLLVNQGREGSRGSWSEWFARKVDFTLNGAPFKGKVGYAVSGAVVPLFDGAAIDLKFAALRSVDPKKAKKVEGLADPSSYQNWIEGTGGLLVLAPVDMDNVIPVSMERVVVTEKGMSATGEKHMEFRAGKRRVTAEELTLTDERIWLSGVQETKPDGGQTPDNLGAWVTGSGISVVEEENAPEPGQKVDSTSASTSESETSDSVSISQSQQASDSQSLQTSETSQTPDLGSETKTDEDAEEKKPDEKEEDESKVKELLVTFFKTLLLGKDDSSDDDESKIELDKEIDIVSGKFIVGFKSKEEDEEKLTDQILNGVTEKTAATIRESIKNLMKKKKSAKEPFVAVKEEAVELIKGYSKDTPGQVKDNLIAMGNLIRDAAKGKDVDSDMQTAFDNAMEALQKDKVMEFLGVDSDDNEESTESGTIPLVSIPITTPLVKFVVNLTPEFTFKPYVNGGVEDLWNLLKEKGTGKEANFTFKAGIKSSLSLTARAGFEESVPLLIKGFQGVKAAAALEGNKEDGVALEGSVTVPVERAKNGNIVQKKDTKVDVDGGFLLKGSVGAEATVSSKLFSWEKTLAEKTFAEWNLLTIGLHIGMTKQPGGGLTRGWQLDEACIAMERNSGLGAAFLENNTEERKYGLVAVDTEESAEYRELQTNFRNALRLLKRFLNAGKEDKEALVIPKKKDETGLTDTTTNLDDMVKSFCQLWIQAERELEVAKNQLEAYKNSGVVSVNESGLMDRIDRHTRRLSDMKAWKKEQEGKLKIFRGDTLEAYQSLSNGAGMGFERYVEEKARDKVYTFDALATYEKNRYRELSKGYDERIAALKSGIKAKKTTKKITDAYKDKGGKALEHKSWVQSLETLKKYEEEKQTKVEEDQQKRYKEITTNSTAKNDPEFFKWYGSKLNTKEHRIFIFRFGGCERLLAYERARLLKKAETPFQTYEAASKQGAPDKAQIEAVRKEYYKTATIDDLIELETQKNMGEEGKLLAAQKGKGGEQSLDQILGAKKAAALSKMEKRLPGRKREDMLPHLTIEMLYAYAQKRKAAELAKPDAEQNKSVMDTIEKEMVFLNQSRILIRSVKTEEQRATEQKEIAAYFERFRDTAEQYGKDLVSGKEMNTELMLDLLSEDADNKLMKLLRERKKLGQPDVKVLTDYLKEGGKEDEVTKFLQEKYKEKAVNSEQYRRFRRWEVYDKNAKHMERYAMLEDLYQGGADYEAMLKAYTKIEGGDGYADALIDELKKNGRVAGQTITVEDVKNYEDGLVKTKGKKYRDRISWMDQRKSEGASDQEIILEYEAKKKEEWWIGKRFINRLMNLDTGFEDAQKDVELTPEQILEIEKLSKDRDMKKHTDRLKMLYGVEELPKNLDSLKPPSAEEMEERRKKYMEEAKRFGDDEELANAVEEEKKRLMSSDVVYGEILTYEQGRQEYYRGEFNKILEVQQDMEKRCTVLEREADLGNRLATKLDQLKDKPEEIFQMIEDFEAAVDWTEESEEKEKEVEAEKDKLLKQGQKLLDDGNNQEE